MRDIIEGIRSEQGCLKDRQKQHPGEESLVTPFGGVNLQVHNKVWQ